MMFARLFIAAALSALALPAAAVDYRSVGVAAAVLYDAPSQQAKKLYLIKAHTPVEAVVKLEGWVKVRDAEGTLAWMEAKQTSAQRTVIVTAAQAALRQEARDDAPLVAECGKWLVLDFVAAGAPGWVQVKHRDGASGFVRANQIWGL
ncbi:SH3 domain-containing protein [Azonexus sp.]|uniref:SH3 domain-containing protein n=1 Tax=Azonexus sp. TaxID=1872668 RepID=UPI0039E71032